MTRYVGCFRYAWGWASKAVEAAAARVKRPEGACKPNGQSDMLGNGICIELADVMDACRRWQVARSDDCRSTQFCCFDGAGGNVTAAPAIASDGGLSSPDTRAFGNRDAILLALSGSRQLTATAVVPGPSQTAAKQVLVSPSTTTTSTSLPIDSTPSTAEPSSASSSTPTSTTSFAITPVARSEYLYSGISHGSTLGQSCTPDSLPIIHNGTW